MIFIFYKRIILFIFILYIFNAIINIDFNNVYIMNFYKNHRPLEIFRIFKYFLENRVIMNVNFYFFLHKYVYI